MPDTRSWRGPHPKDLECFSARWLPVLRSAVADLSWLLGRGYSGKASLKLVGDRYALRDRQRKALQRCAASDAACRERHQKRLSTANLAGETVAVDGYNVLLTLEAALSGGVLLLARDGVLRDLAAMSAHYRRLQATRPAIDLLAQFFADAECARVIWYLDRPVSNSGRLKRLIQETVSQREPPWRVDLTDRTDSLLMRSPHVVATADSAVLDGCHRWVNLARAIVETSIPEAWILDLEAGTD
jgi:hypothetical protein